MLIRAKSQKLQQNPRIGSAGVVRAKYTGLDYAGSFGVHRETGIAPVQHQTNYSEQKPEPIGIDGVYPNGCVRVDSVEPG